MVHLKISVTLMKCVFRAMRVYDPTYTLNKKEKKYALGVVHTNLGYMLNSGQSHLKIKGERLPMTTIEGKLDAAVLKNVVDERSCCLEADEDTFSRELANTFAAYALIPPERQTLLTRCKLVTQDGKVFLLAIEDEPTQPIRNHFKSSRC